MFASTPGDAEAGRHRADREVTIRENGAMRRPAQLVAAGLLVAAGTVWLAVNKQVGEGPVLLTVATNHGLTTADLASLGAFAAAAWLVHRTRPINPSSER
jgi:hypothetical protein